MNFLIVEDNDKTAEIMKKFLQIEGINIFTAGDSFTAQRLLQNTHIDCILSDLNLPYRNGFSFIKDINDNSETQLIPSLVYSSRPIDPEEIERVKIRYGINVCPETDPEKIIQFAKNTWKELINQ